MIRDSAMKKILFVCLGNICRSPAAHAIFQKMVDDAGLSDEFYIDSAGTANYHCGELPDARMREHGARRGYNIDSRARQLEEKDGEEFDLILVMDYSNSVNAKKIINKKQHHKINMLLNFINDKSETEVPDPYYQGEEGFEFVLELLETSSKKLLTKIQ